MGRGNGSNSGLGQRLRQARIEAGLTQKQAGEAIGVDPNTIYSYETDRVNPSGPALRSLAHAYNKPMEWFFADKEKAGSEEFSPLTPEQVEANLDLVLSAPMIALRAAADDLDDDAIADIADYIRFVREREERRRCERQGEG